MERPLRLSLEGLQLDPQDLRCLAELPKLDALTLKGAARASSGPAEPPLPYTALPLLSRSKSLALLQVPRARRRGPARAFHDGSQAAASPQDCW